MKHEKQILSITVKHEEDYSPDTSWLGEFSNRAESDYAINHRERNGDARSCEYFNPVVSNYKGMTEDEIKTYCEQDYERMMQLERGVFSFIGVRAEAEIQLTDDLTQTIRSGGLWGIESDSDKTYLKEVEQEELHQLAEELKAMGFTDEQIQEAIED